MNYLIIPHRGKTGVNESLARDCEGFCADREADDSTHVGAVVH